MPANVLIVDTHELIRLGLRTAFEQTDDLHVVAEAGSLDEARAMERAHRPDVLVIDMHLDDGRGLDLVRTLRNTRPGLGVVALTKEEGDEDLFAALAAGASAFASTWSPCQEVVTAARSAGAAPSSFSASDLAGAMRRRGQSPAVQLTTREDDVLQLLSEGLSVAQVSAQLFISPSTAKTHMAKLYDKLGASNRTQAVMSAVRLGLVRPHAAAS